MVWEIAQLEIRDDHNEAFESAVAEAAPLFQRAHGCRSMQVQHSVELPQRYRLIVEWNTIEDHTVRFRESEDFQKWRSLVGEHFAEPPVVEHTHALAVGFQATTEPAAGSAASHQPFATPAHRHGERLYVSIGVTEAVGLRTGSAVPSTRCTSSMSGSVTVRMCGHMDRDS